MAYTIEHSKHPSEASRGAGPNAEQKALLRKTRCVVGPFALERAVDARAWLNAGARYVLLTAPDAATAAEAVVEASKREGLPAERLLRLVAASNVNDEAEGQRLDALRRRGDLAGRRPPQRLEAHPARAGRRQSGWSSPPGGSGGAVVAVIVVDGEDLVACHEAAPIAHRRHHQVQAAQPVLC